MNNNKNMEEKEKAIKLPSKRINIICLLFCLSMEITSFFMNFTIMSVLYLIITIIGSAIELFILSLRVDLEINFSKELNVKGFFSFVFAYLEKVLIPPCIGSGPYCIFVIANTIICFIVIFLPVPFLFYLPMAAVLFASENFFLETAPKAYVIFSIIVSVLLLILFILAIADYWLGFTTLHTINHWMQSIDLDVIYRRLPAGESL